MPVNFSSVSYDDISFWCSACYTRSGILYKIFLSLRHVVHKMIYIQIRLTSLHLIVAVKGAMLSVIESKKVLKHGITCNLLLFK